MSSNEEGNAMDETRDVPGTSDPTQRLAVDGAELRVDDPLEDVDPDEDDLDLDDLDLDDLDDEDADLDLDEESRGRATLSAAPAPR
jgi:hypothetical protein